MRAKAGPLQYLKVTTIRGSSGCGPELLGRLNAQAREYGAELVSGRVTALRKEGETFVATCSGGDVNARFILLATGLVDHCPPIEGHPAECPSEVIRFCPICDGYEAIDRRVGVLGDIKAGGKKALFLHTYTKDISLFLADETEDVDWHEKLTKANVRIVGEFQRVRQETENTVTVATRQGETHEVDALYPALGCAVRSDLASEDARRSGVGDVPSDGFVCGWMPCHCSVVAG